MTGRSAGTAETSPAGGTLWISLLGQFEVLVNSVPVELPPGRQATLLAVLALSPGRVVSVERLAAQIWGEELPVRVKGSLHTLVMRLRGRLGSQVIVTAPDGYRLDLSPSCIDLWRFRSLVTEADEADSAEKRGGLLEEGLRLWRGEPLAGLRSEALERDEVPALIDEYLTAVHRRVELDLAVGRNASVITELRDLTARYPLWEPLWYQLVRALDGAGRHAQAIETYHQARTRLAEDLGLDPSPQLQDLYGRILRQESGSGDEQADAAAGDAPGAAAAQFVRPSQVPADVRYFMGRDGELHRLDTMLAEHSAQPDAAAMAVVVHGGGGIGKTALAVHWAHRVAGQFPDGQLYVDLRGFSPGARAMPPGEAVRGFLEALGVPAARIPASLGAQTALYRSVLAGKRALVLLDNARDAEQVRPLLPGTPSAVTVVTSRNQLTSLVAGAGAYPLALGLLSAEDARGLLAQRLGADRIGEPEAVTQIVSACAGLPLALNIAAARALQTGFSLASLAAELGTAGERLAALDAGDAATDVRAVFSCSYAALSPAAARQFRLLGLHPGPVISLGAAASLTGLSEPESRRLLTELTRASLLTEHAPGRYGLHDLLRDYAVGLTQVHDAHEERRAAIGRMLDYHVSIACAGDRILNPLRDPVRLAPATPGPGARPALTEYGQVMDWFSAERAVLLAMLKLAADGGHDACTWQLSWSLDTFLERRSYRRERLTAWRLGLRAAQRLGDVGMQADAHRHLIHASAWLERYDDAIGHSRHAVDLYARLGDQAGQGHTQRMTAQMWERRGDISVALRHAQQAVGLYRAAGHDRGQAAALNAIGYYYTLLGDHTQAIVESERALALFQKLGDREGEMATWDSVGHAQHHLGDYRQAADSYEKALSVFRDLGDNGAWWIEGTILAHLGDTYHAAGDQPNARLVWARALEIFTGMDHPDAAEVRGKLDALDADPPV